MPQANDEDIALSRRAARGDHLAFALLVEKYEAPLRSFLARMGAGDLTDDIAQEAFLKAWRAAGQYDGEPAIRPGSPGSPGAAGSTSFGASGRWNRMNLPGSQEVPTRFTICLRG